MCKSLRHPLSQSLPSMASWWANCAAHLPPDLHASGNNVLTYLRTTVTPGVR